MNREKKMELQKKIEEEELRIEKYMKVQVTNAKQLIDESHDRIADYRKQIREL
jgi:hypothetical protein